jgi:osmoprotectant transport system substrate-binding protein
MRQDFLAAHPAIADVLNPVAAKLDNETILKLSVKIDGDGDDPAVVARDWLVEQGFVTSPKA